MNYCSGMHCSAQSRKRWVHKLLKTVCVCKIDPFHSLFFRCGAISFWKCSVTQTVASPLNLTHWQGVCTGCALCLRIFSILHWRQRNNSRKTSMSNKVYLQKIRFGRRVYSSSCIFSWIIYGHLSVRIELWIALQWKKANVKQPNDVKEKKIIE